MRYVKFKGHITWQSEELSYEDSRGVMHYGQKYVICNNNDGISRAQSVAFEVWNDRLREKLNYDIDRDVCVHLICNVFPLDDTYYTNVRCVGVHFVKEKGGNS